MMFTFPSTPKWYKLAAAIESEADEIFAAPFHLSELIKSDEINVDSKNIRQIRKLEGFSTLFRKLRVSRGLSIEKLSKKIDVDAAELILLETIAGYRATPRTISAVAAFYQLSLMKLLQLSGASKNLDDETENAVIRFAAESESFERLSNEEKKILNRIVKILSDN